MRTVTLRATAGGPDGGAGDDRVPVVGGAADRQLDRLALGFIVLWICAGLLSGGAGVALRGRGRRCGPLHETADDDRDDRPAEPAPADRVGAAAARAGADGGGG